MLRIGILGPGKVGTALARYLVQQNMDVMVYGRDLEKTRIIFNGSDIQVARSLEVIIVASDILMLTTSDDAIAEVAGRIADLDVDLNDKVIFHCSGALSGQVLKPCDDKGAVLGSLHPLKAFAGDERDVTELSKTFLTVESNDLENCKIEELLKRMGNPYQVIRSEDKVLYHGAAVVMSNYLVTLVEEGLTYLRKAGFRDSEAIGMMMPLMKGTLANIEVKGTQDSLTGPIQRGDSGTVSRHLSAIERALGDTASAFYRQMGLKTVDMLRDQRLSGTDAAKMEQLLRAVRDKE